MKYLAACCTVKNEDSHILEWMAFHTAVGFEHLIIVDHASTDRTADVVSRFYNQANVTLIRWDRPGSQMDMYNAVVSQFRDDFHWCAFIDADEFMYTSGPTDIRNLLTEYEEHDALGVHWMLYGSAGHFNKPKGLTIENYLKRSDKDFQVNRHVKSIVKIGSVGLAETSHLFSTKNSTVDENFEILPFQAPHGYFDKKTPTHERIRINHYHTRSWEDYNQKASRGFFGADDGKLGNNERIDAMFRHHNRNEVEDRSALRFSRLTRFFIENSDCR